MIRTEIRNRDIISVTLDFNIPAIYIFSEGVFYAFGFEHGVVIDDAVLANAELIYREGELTDHGLARLAETDYYDTMLPDHYHELLHKHEQLKAHFASLRAAMAIILQLSEKIASMPWRYREIVQIAQDALKGDSNE